MLVSAQTKAIVVAAEEINKEGGGSPITGFPLKMVMRDLIKELIVEDGKYIFNGNTFDIFKVNDENEYQDYLKGNDENVRTEHYIKPNTLCKVTLNISNTCNLNCKYCYANAGKYSTDRTELMNETTVDKIMYELKRRGISSIETLSLFGGEPFLNWNTIKYSIERFCSNFEIESIEIISNGWFVDNEKLEFLKRYNVKIVISVDGPEDITDCLRGKGTYKQVVRVFDEANKSGYNNISASATYTGYHEKYGYSYADVDNYFAMKKINATVSRVISSEKSMLPNLRRTDTEIEEEINNSALKIYHNDHSGSLNPYLIRVMESLCFDARNLNNCDDLDARRTISFDYNGELYNCIHFYGDCKYKLTKNECCNDIIKEYNDKSRNELCSKCWAKYLCRICTAALIQNSFSIEYIDGECSDCKMYERALRCIMKYIIEGKKELFENFVKYFI